MITKPKYVRMIHTPGVRLTPPTLKAKPTLASVLGDLIPFAESLDIVAEGYRARLACNSEARAADALGAYTLCAERKQLLREMTCTIELLASANAWLKASTEVLS